MRFLLRSTLPFMLAMATVGAPAVAFAQADVGLSITLAPPALPVYAQPEIPGSGYIWTPGYWAWAPEGYYWVPGTWVQPPSVGLLWTPGYWGWNNGNYAWNAGYWGPQVGYYGGINYGYGYGGNGYGGGYWRNNSFYYNRSANNIGGAQITNVYTKPVPSMGSSHVSFNGGRGGTTVRPTAQQTAMAHASHTPPTPLQTQHESAARANPALRDSVNHGRPTIAATQKPGVMEGPGVVPARASKAAGTAHPPVAGASHPQRTAGPAAAPKAPGAAHPPAAAARQPQHNARPAAEPKASGNARPPAAAASQPQRNVRTTVAPKAPSQARPPVAAAHPPAQRAAAPRPAASQPVRSGSSAPSRAAAPRAAPAHAAPAHAAPKPEEDKK
jgi:hypothetical protein